MNNKDRTFSKRSEDTNRLMLPSVREILENKDRLDEEDRVFIEENFNDEDFIDISVSQQVSAVTKLKTYYGNSSWNASMKEEIVNYISVLGEFFKMHTLRIHLPSFKLLLIYHMICAYKDRLNEFDYYQRVQIIESIDPIDKYVAKLLRRG
ncbi:uncharacterized protein LOC126550009 [Aphis gossypii]|uniref:uncharacterized protein LOC126550009 n=1 Tax=Aphis gossypii TaxID=80765 RepID=UPI00215986E6|nr:uncharacterized protein LOC126550009 [Aphis gossypii]